MLLTAPASIAGGLGLVCVGWSVSHAHARRLDGGWFDRAVLWSRSGGLSAMALGAGTALVPVGGAHARAAVSLVETGQSRLGPGLLFWLGACIAEVVTVGALGLGSARPATLPVAAVLLAVVVLGAALLRKRETVHSVAHLVAGWAVIVIGAQLLQHGFASTETPFLAGLSGGGFWVRIVTMLVLGASLTAAFDNGTLVAAIAVGATAGGALEASAAAALLVGVRVGTGLAVYPRLRHSSGDVRRATIGILLTSALQGVLGLLLVAIMLPLFMHEGITPLGLALTLLAFQGTFVALSIVMSVPFHAALVAGLDERIEDAEGAGQSPRLEVGGLARLALHDRAVRMRRIARNLAQTVLTGNQVTGFRLNSDREEVYALADDAEAISLDLLGSSVGARTSASVLAATRLDDLPALIEELAALSPHDEAALRAAHPALGQLMREAEMSTLHVIHLALGTAASQAVEELTRGASDVSAKLAWIEQVCLVSHDLDDSLRLTTIWRVGRLRWVLQIALGTTTFAAQEVEVSRAPAPVAA